MHCPEEQCQRLADLPLHVGQADDNQRGDDGPGLEPGSIHFHILKDFRHRKHAKQRLRFDDPAGRALRSSEGRQRMRLRLRSDRLGQDLHHVRIGREGAEIA